MTKSAPTPRKRKPVQLRAVKRSLSILPRHNEFIELLGHGKASLGLRIVIAHVMTRTPQQLQALINDANETLGEPRATEAVRAAHEREAKTSKTLASDEDDDADIFG